MFLKEFLENLPTMQRVNVWFFFLSPVKARWVPEWSLKRCWRYTISKFWSNKFEIIFQSISLTFIVGAQKNRLWRWFFWVPSTYVFLFGWKKTLLDLISSPVEKFLTPITCALYLWDVGKCCRPTPDAEEYGIWSGSPKFACWMFY